jgi:hypothetical protein
MHIRNRASQILAKATKDSKERRRSKKGGTMIIFSTFRQLGSGLFLSRLLFSHSLDISIVPAKTYHGDIT